ncbi:hypothetical protein ACSTIS_23615, partial [Vibrio parahaemolyticus]
MVNLKITAVHIDLAAPVVIYLPRQAQPDVVSHEEGHVKICRRIYEYDAAPAAIRAGDSVIGKEFTASGD